MVARCQAFVFSLHLDHHLLGVAVVLHLVGKVGRQVVVMVNLRLVLLLEVVVGWGVVVSELVVS
jgi:hypothetical protein